MHVGVCTKSSDQKQNQYVFIIFPEILKYQSHENLSLGSQVVTLNRQMKQMDLHSAGLWAYLKMYLSLRIT